MQQHPLLFLVLICLVASASAQELATLTELPGKSFKVYYSAGHQQRTSVTAQRVEKATRFNESLLGFKPTITLLVLAPADWKTFAAQGAVYGMPHYDQKNHRLIVAAEDNPFWKSFLPPVDQLPPAWREPMVATYKGSDGGLSAQAFFDLLAIHELGHEFHIQGGLTMQRKWMGELFCNILLHTYIAENEPSLLPALMLFPKLVVAGGTKGYAFTSLADLESNYNEIAMNHPRNYGWYQCRWHQAAGVIYDAGGKQVLRNLWDALKTKKEVLSDDQLIDLLEEAGATGVADMMRNWERDTVK